MLDDLRQLTLKPWRRRARIYGVAVAVLAACITVFHADPAEAGASGAPLWIAFASGVLALSARAMAPPRRGEQPRQTTPVHGQPVRSLSTRA